MPSPGAPGVSGNTDQRAKSTMSTHDEETDAMAIVDMDKVTHTAVQDGEWSDSATWTNGVPGEEDYVLIPGKYDVTLSSQQNSRLDTVLVKGSLTFDPSTDTKLRTENLVTLDNSRLEIGTKSHPIQQNVTAEIEIVDHGPIDESVDPDRVGKTIMTMGHVEIHGAEKTSWITLAQNPKQGDTSIELSSEPTNWQKGDQIVIPGLEPYPDYQDEERTITNVSSTTVSFDKALEYDHVPPESDLDTYCLNLTRNVKFYSENTDISRRGHFIIMSHGSKIRYLETKDMGRTDKTRDITTPPGGRGTPKPDSPPNPNARYSIHTHRTGPEARPHIVEGCSVHRNPGWGIVNHESRMNIENCVTYKVTGAGIVAEHGNETGYWKNNFACHSMGSGEEIDSRKGWSNAFGTKFLDPPHNIDDFGHGGHGFWSQSYAVEMEGNIAASHRHHGFAIYGRSLLEEPLNHEEGMNVKNLDGKEDTYPDFPSQLLNNKEKRIARYGDEQAPHTGQSFTPKKVYSDTIGLRKFKDNTAFACGGGLDLSRHQFRDPQNRIDWEAVENFTAYNIGPLILKDGSKHGYHNFQSSGNVGVDHRYTDNLVSRNSTFIGTGEGYGVYSNHAYIGTYDVENCVIKNWRHGYKNPAYSGRYVSRVTDCEFDNHIDLVFDGNTQRERYLLAKNNTYNGDYSLKYEEIGVPSAFPGQFLQSHRLSGNERSDSGIRFEGQTVYHGWSHPDFVMVKEGDTERLNKLMNHGHGEQWRKALGVDSVEKVKQILPGTTHQELYDQYGVTFYGGIIPEDATQPDYFTGSGGDYDSTPYLGPDPSQNVMPTHEFWVDPKKMDMTGDATVVGAEDSPECAIEQANNGELVKLVSHTGRFSDRNGPEGNDGILSWEMDMSKSGRHDIWIRKQIDQIGQNNRAVFFRFNSNNWKKYAYLNGEDCLKWEKIDSFDLSKGKNTLEVAAWHTDVRIDKILVRHTTSAANPIGKGKPHTPKS